MISFWLQRYEEFMKRPNYNPKKARSYNLFVKYDRKCQNPDQCDMWSKWSLWSIVIKDSEIGNLFYYNIYIYIYIIVDNFCHPKKVNDN